MAEAFKSDEEVERTRDDLEMMRRRYLWPGDVLCLKRRSRLEKSWPEFAVLLYYQKHYRFIPRRGYGDDFEEEKARTGGDELLLELVEEGWLVD